jgi:hypothetical protein
MYASILNFPEFSQCGEIVSKKRNRLNPKTVEKIMFLNKNL